MRYVVYSFCNIIFLPRVLFVLCVNIIMLCFFIYIMFLVNLILLCLFLVICSVHTLDRDAVTTVCSVRTFILYDIST
jgi:hypothetical protein